MDSSEVRRHWSDRSGTYSPAFYADYGPDGSSESVRRLLERFVGPEASVLELGCSSGRHLAHLREHGFRDLSGIEVNGDAFEVMADAYPGLAADGTFYHGAIEDVVGDLDDDRFDAVFSVETLQHLHPDVAWVFDEIGRITGDLLVTVENEGDAAAGETESDAAAGGAAGPQVSYVDDEFPLYHRDWGSVFTSSGFEAIDVESESVAADPNDRDTVRAFRPTT